MLNGWCLSNQVRSPTYWCCCQDSTNVVLVDVVRTILLFMHNSTHIHPAPAYKVGNLHSLVFPCKDAMCEDTNCTYRTIHVSHFPQPKICCCWHHKNRQQSRGAHLILQWVGQLWFYVSTWTSLSDSFLLCRQLLLLDVVRLSWWYTDITLDTMVVYTPQKLADLVTDVPARYAQTICPPLCCVDCNILCTAVLLLC